MVPPYLFLGLHNAVWCSPIGSTAKLRLVTLMGLKTYILQGRWPVALCTPKATSILIQPRPAPGGRAHG